MLLPTFFFFFRKMNQICANYSCKSLFRLKWKNASSYLWVFTAAVFNQSKGGISLINRFHVAVRLFCNRSQMTSKCRKNKKWHTSRSECVTVVFTTFWRPLWSITEQTHGNMEYICFIQWSEKKTTDTHTCLEPLDLLRICASFRHFLSPKPNFSS